MKPPHAQVEINIGKACNNACVFCANGARRRGERGWVPAETVAREIRRRAAEGFTSLGFLGGEPTVYPPMIDLIRDARGRGFSRITVVTNGRRLGDAALLDRFLEAGVTRFSLSIHSHEQTVEDRLCMRRGAFREKIAAIDNLVRAAAAGRLPDGLSLNSCIHGLNYRVLPGMAQFFHARGVRDMRFNCLRPERMAIGNAELTPRLTDCVPGLLALIVLNEQWLRMTVTFGDIPFCLWPATILARRPLLNRYLGERRDLDTSVSVLWGEDRAGTPDRFSWKARRAGTLKCKAAACRTCARATSCEGLWIRYAELYGTGELRRIPR